MFCGIGIESLKKKWDFPPRINRAVKAQVRGYHASLEAGVVEMTVCEIPIAI